MPRRGCIRADNVSWVQILRGPRPQATTRPKREGPQPIAVTAQGRWKGTNGSDRPPAEGAQFGSCVGGFGTRRLRHEIRARDGPQKCEGTVLILSEWIETRRLLQPQDGCPGWEQGKDVKCLRAAFKPKSERGKLSSKRRKKRIAKIDKREAGVRSVEDAEHMSNHLRALSVHSTAEAKPASIFPDWIAEVQRLQAIVAHLQKQPEQSGGSVPAAGANPVWQRLRANFVPHWVEKMPQWMWDGQQNLQEAIMAVRRCGDGQNIPVDVSRRPRMARSAHGCHDHGVSTSLFNSGSHGAVISGLGMFLGRGPSPRIVGATWVSSVN